MKDCADIDAIMTAYVDGEVPGGEVADIEAHLEECPSCRERAAAEQTAKAVLQARASELTGAASAALRARCEAAAPPEHVDGRASQPLGWTTRLRGWAPLSMAAALLLAVGAVFVMGQNQQLEAAFAAQLAIDHDRCFSHLEGVDRAFGQPEAEGDVAALAGFEVTLPAESADFDLLHVRECLFDAGAMLHVLCRWQGSPVSLFILPGADRREQVLEIVGHDAVIWSDEGSGYVLVAEHGPVDIGQVARYVRGRRD